MFTLDEARALLNAAQVFHDVDPDEGTSPQLLNLNDAYYWGTSDAEVVSDEEMPRLAELFRRYGRCGVLYWASRRKEHRRKPEFYDVQRFLKFVEEEEALRTRVPESAQRAYEPLAYTLGETCKGSL